jgi:CheY-like chemotaxis protein
VALDPDGVVIAANTAAMVLLGRDPVGQVFATRVCSGASELAVRRHLFDAFKSRQRQWCEVELFGRDDTRWQVRLESIADPYQQVCLTALVEKRPPPRRSGVLVVEDDRLVRMTLRHYLQRAGRQVFEARDIASALAACRDHVDGIGWLIADVVLPGACGPELAARLSLIIPKLEVLYISGHPRELLVRTRRLDPADRMLQKPFSEGELLSAIDR